MQPTNKKIVPITPPAASASGATFAAAPVDTIGFTHVDVYALLGAVGAAMTALKVQESDSLTAGALTAPTDVPGTVVGVDGSDGSATPSSLPAGPQANGVVKFEIDMRGRKRYLGLVATAGGGATFLTAFALLGRGENSPTTAAQKNVTLCMKN